MEEIERRVMIRFTGPEAEFLLDLLEHVHERLTEAQDEEGAQWLIPIAAKLSTSLGRANRLAKVLKDKPLSYLQDLNTGNFCEGTERDRKKPKPKHNY
jgi:hypothetical protein